MEDRGALPSLLRSGPPAGYAADRISFRADAVGRCDALHDAVERTAGSDSFELTFHGCYRRPEASHCGRIFTAEGMDHGPRLLDCCVLADFGLHLFLLRLLALARNCQSAFEHSQRSRRTKWRSRPDSGAPTSCIAPPMASDPRSIATKPVLLINSITSCLASVSSPDVKMTVRGCSARSPVSRPSACS